MKRIMTLALSLVLLLSMASCEKSSDKVLRVGMECAYAPYNWTQIDDSNGAVPIADTGEYAYGYDVMMAKYLADKMGLELQIKKIDWDSLPVAVQSGTIDCVIAGQSITAKRLKAVDFTTPYYYASVVALTSSSSKFANAKSVADLDGAKATSQINTIWYDVCLPQIPNCAIQTAMETAPSMLVALNSGIVDLVVTDAPTAQAAVIAYPDLKVLNFAGSADDFKVSEEEINIGISVKKGNTELLDALNAALANLTTADFEKMMADAILAQPLSK
ncbi:MAG: transporter substrate-binding domain-containing protein [Oscillospiraceae bacterium]